MTRKKSREETTRKKPSLPGIRTLRHLHALTGVTREPYLQFSSFLTGITEEEEQWVRETLTLLSIVCEGQPSEEEGAAVEKLDFYEDFLDEGVGIGFSWRLDLDGIPRLWFYAEGNGVPGHVALFVRSFLRRFRPDESWGMAWSETGASIYDVDVFGGGAVFVSRDVISYVEAAEWLHICLSEFHRERRKGD